MAKLVFALVFLLSTLYLFQLSVGQPEEPNLTCPRPAFVTKHVLLTNTKEAAETMAGRVVRSTHTNHQNLLVSGRSPSGYRRKLYDGVDVCVSLTAVPAWRCRTIDKITWECNSENNRNAIHRFSNGHFMHEVAYEYSTQRAPMTSYSLEVQEKITKKPKQG